MGARRHRRGRAGRALRRPAGRGRAGRHAHRPRRPRRAGRGRAAGRGRRGRVTCLDRGGRVVGVTDAKPAQANADDVVIATKAGLLRTGPDVWVPLGHPSYLRQQCELSLRRLGVEAIDLFQLHRVDPAYPLEDQVGELAKLRDEGKVRHVGLSEVSIAQVEEARAVTDIATVQNLFNLTTRDAEPLLDYCEAEGIGFIPWFPLATGELSKQDGPLAQAATEHGAEPAQLALAWLLRRSPAVLPIPGTKSVDHLESNVAAAGIELSDDEFAALDAVR
ncbi:aldo/keto reductase [Nocardioides sp. ChNu-153]|nr:aldo/keto reductase [Nocardioides sp. ChNu-99]MDN7122884.1 aldo/keto reductase [Nocardioides sp. ChNu-153]